MTQTLINALFYASLALPLLGVVVSMLWYRDGGANTLTQSLFALSGASGALMLVGYAFAGQSMTFGPFPYETSFVILFLALVYVGVFFASVFAISYLPKYRDTYNIPLLNIATAFFILGMIGVVLSWSIATFLAAWEVMSVAAYFLVIADRQRDSLRAGFLYFLMTHIGFLCIASGFLILSRGDIFAPWAQVAQIAAVLSPTALSVAFLLLFAGFGSKAGLVPLHQWLPLAHPQAPSHSSALLSGTMLKVALFGFISSLSLFPILPVWWALVVIAVGLVSALFGVLYAAVDTDLKRLLAWSSVENMGLIFSGVGVVLALEPLMATSAAANILAATVSAFVALHIINHFFFKTGLFLAVGAVASETHTRDLDRLGGLAQKWPLFSGVALALALAAAALPPSGTFFGEWLYLQSLAAAMLALPTAYAVAAALILAVVALVGGLAIFTFVKLFALTFLGRARSEHAEHVGVLSGPLLWVPFSCAAGSVLVALFASYFSSDMAGASSAIGVLPSVSVADGAAANAWFIYILIALVLGGIYAAYRTFARRAITVTDTWDCGQALTPRMQYTATGFAAPIRFFFRGVLLSTYDVIHTPLAATNPWIASTRLEGRIGSIWENILYAPIAAAVLYISSHARKLQSGVIQLYLLFVVIALIVVLALALH